MSAHAAAICAATCCGRRWPPPYRDLAAGWSPLSYDASRWRDPARDPPFRHLLRLTDDIGLLRARRRRRAAARARLLRRRRRPRPGRGRAASRHRGAELVALARRYLRLPRAGPGAPTAAFRNRLGYDRRWRTSRALGDCWGRALWGLGTAAAQGPDRGDPRGVARPVRLRRPGPLARGRTPMAFAALGAAEVLGGLPGHSARSACSPTPSASSASRPPAPRGPGPSRGSATRTPRCAEAVIVAGCEPGRRSVLARRPAHAGVAAGGRDPQGSPVGDSGGGLGSWRAAAGFDQQPIEAAALADACARAAAVTGDTRWLDGVGMCVAWFLGDNDAQVPLLDERDRRLLRRPEPYQPQPKPGRRVDTGDDLGAASTAAASSRATVTGAGRPLLARTRHRLLPDKSRTVGPAVRSWPGDPDLGRLAGQGGHRPRPRR